jgi:hypothetical protein
MDRTDGAGRGEKEAQMPERLVQFMGTADPKVALVDLSAICGQ